jgi:hypothetical protein
MGWKEGSHQLQILSVEMNKIATREAMQPDTD